MVALRKAKGILTQVHNQNIIIQNKYNKTTVHDRIGKDREYTAKDKAGKEVVHTRGLRVQHVQ